jgi:WD40 repeat protein
MWLVSGSWDRTVRLWDISLDSWHDHACTLANRNLDAAEVTQYFRDRPYSPACADN